MLRVLVLSAVALIAFPMTVDSQEQPFHAMTKEEFATFSDSLNADLIRWKLLISQIDVTELHLIDYGEGKQIESFQSICSQELDQIQFDLSTLKQQHSITFLISLLAHTDDFHHSVDILEGMIGIRAFPDRTAQDYPKTRKWADGLQGIGKALYPQRKRLLDHSLALAMAVDIILKAQSSNH